MKRSLSLLRYHRKSQILRRAAGLLWRRTVRWTGVREPAVPTKLEVRSNPAFLEIACRRTSSRRPEVQPIVARAILDQHFTLLNCSRYLPDPIDWRLDEHQSDSHLWQFRLHEQEYLLDMMAQFLSTKDEKYRDRIWSIVLQWIVGNPLRDTRVLHDAWHPYCISRRLPIWICLWTLLAPSPDKSKTMLDSLFQQAAFLERHLERDLGGNHLLDNARALAMAGAFFAGAQADRWLATAAAILQAELPEQVLPSGEHFERSPMYHVHALEMLLDTAECVHEVDQRLGRSYFEQACRMASFLENILHPDGEIPLFGDSCFNQTTTPAALIAAVRSAEGKILGKPAGPSKSTLAASMGCAFGDYWLFRDSQISVLFDGGAVAPDHLPAHGHCDLLNLEVSVCGKRFVVDSGTFNYEADAMRDYCRSTEAHNVLQIDAVPMCDVWSKFRMGYRGTSSGIASGIDHDFSWVRASHNAYRRVGVPTIQRWLACRTGGPLICVDFANGRDRHSVTTRLHMHPDVQVVPEANGRFRCTLHGREVWIQFLGVTETRLESAWYCPEFGRRMEAPVLSGRCTATLPLSVGWIMTLDQCGNLAELLVRPDGSSSVEWSTGSVSVTRDV